MERVRTSTVCDAVVAATTSYDVVVPQGAAGVMLNIDTSAETATGSYVVSISRLTPNGNAISLLSTGAITTETGTRAGVIPGCVAVANVLANEPVGDTIRVTLTRTTGGFTFKINADWYR